MLWIRNFLTGRNRRKAKGSSHRARRDLRRRTQLRRRSMQCEQLDTRTLMAADLSTSSLEDPSPRGVEQHALIVQLKAGNDAPAVFAATVAGNENWPTHELLPGMFKLEYPDVASADAAMAQFTADERVEFAERDAKINGHAWKPDDPFYSSQWALENSGKGSAVKDADIDSQAAWKVTKGMGKTIVAVIDTGIDWKHPDLKNNIWQNGDELPGNGIDDDRNGYVDDVRGWDFVDWDNNPADENGHGTHVAGIIGAKGDNGRGVAGVSWNVDIMPLRFLDADGSGYSSDAIQALRYAVDNGATLSNNSWGGDSYSSAFRRTIEYARDHGHILVAAAGNDGASLNREPQYPASYNQFYDKVVTVAASNSKDQLASFSNYGSHTVDIAAPGVNIMSTVPRNMGPDKHEGYDSYSGTSMATPFVTGTLSLVHDLHPDWSYRQLIDHVLATSDHPQSLTKVVEQGRRLNLGRAVAQAARMAGMAGVESYPADAIDSQPSTAVLRAAESSALANVAVAANSVGKARIAMIASDDLNGCEDLQTATEATEATEADAELQAAAASIPQDAKYKVTVKGKVNGKKFELTGFVKVKPTMNTNTLNDINPRDVFLKIGDPLAKPKTGAIWLATNNAFFRSFGYTKADQKMDLADVDMNSEKGTIKTRMDKDLVASGLNRFNASGGLLAPMYDIFKGGLSLTFTKSGQGIKGKVELKGALHYVPGLSSSTVSYEATISGYRVG